MDNKKKINKRDTRDPVNIIIGWLSIVFGLLFVYSQTLKIFNPELSEIGMKTLPIGLFDWGFTWADTIIIVPFLVIGGVLLVGKNLGKQLENFGLLLLFGGYLINFYDMIVFYFGYSAIGPSLEGGLFWELIITGFIAFFLMIWCGLTIIKRSAAVNEL